MNNIKKTKDLYYTVSYPIGTIIRLKDGYFTYYGEDVIALLICYDKAGDACFKILGKETSHVYLVNTSTYWLSKSHTVISMPPRSN